MNSSIVRIIISYIFKTMGLLMLLPTVISVVYLESAGIWYLCAAAFCFVIGLLLGLKKPSSTVFYLKEGCVATALSWLVMSFTGAVPFYLSGEIPSYIDALFETVSGFTTTGATILNNVEAMSHCGLFWRSFTHWIGGMGILVFILAVIPLTGGSNINLMRAESPGPSVGKLVPKIRQTARILYIIYCGLTVLEFVFLLLGGLPAFDSICMSFGTAGTGGFSPLNDSAASYSPYLQWVLTIFMITFGVNFNAFYLIILRQARKALAMDEVRWYLAIIVFAVTVITVENTRIFKTVFESLTHSAFQVASIISTTGFSTVDFDQWSSLSKAILVGLMFCGACAGSTGGGAKVSRILIGVKSIFNEIHSYVHPKSVRRINMDGRPIDDEVIRSTSVFFLAYIMIFSVSMLLLSAEGYDFLTNFTAVAATMNNIGPGLSLVGPSRNFAFFNDLSKLLLSFDMLAGRLELFPMLLLFSPSVWKSAATGMVSRRRRRREQA